MTEEKGYTFDTHAILEEMRGDGMAEYVEGDFFGLNRLISAGCLQVFEAAVEGVGGTDKQPFVIQFEQVAEVVNIMLQCLADARIYWYETVFVVFSLSYEYGFFVEIYVAHRQFVPLRSAQTAAVKEGEN